jgi:hypothetical protein
MNSYFTTELVRPWKLITLALGIGLLWVGMIVSPAPDWTWSTILATALATHVLAGWSVDVFWRLDWRQFPLAVAAGWFCVDGVWMLSIDGSDAAWGMRGGQWLASLCLFMCYGLITRHRGDLRSLLTYERRTA